MPARPVIRRRVCAVGGCGAWQVRDGRCARHAKARDLARGTAAERGYDATHRKIRADLLAELARMEARGVVMLCPRCLNPMRTTQELDAGHGKVKASEGGRADRLEHAACNRGKVGE